MRINDFKLEVFFEKHEFSAPYLLAQSDCESMSLDTLLQYEPGAKKQLMAGWLGYTEVAGGEEIRNHVAQLYNTLAPNDILMHAGAQEGVFTYMNTLLEAGDHVICMTPTYQSLFEIAHAIGAEVSDWTLHQGEAGWHIDFEELKELIRPNTKLIVINTPNNPTGYTFSTEELKMLCAIAEQHGIYIFADEVYKGLDLDNTPKPWVADLYEKATSLGVLSKSYGLPGLRIGWLVGKDEELLSKIKKYKFYLSICNSGPSEFLGVVALKNGDALLQRNIGIIQKNLSYANDFFARYDDYFVNNAQQCGPIAFHSLKGGLSADTFCNELVSEAGILLLPGSTYGFSDSYFRMGYGRSNFCENLDRLDQFLEKKLRR